MPNIDARVSLLMLHLYHLCRQPFMRSPLLGAS